MPSNEAANGLANGQSINVEKLASLPNLPDQVPPLLQQIQSDSKHYEESPQARLQLLENARSLVYALETPRESLIRHCWSESTSYAAIHTGVDLDLFKALGTDDKPRTVDELAKATDADPILLGRLLKHMAAMGVILETGNDEYRSTGFSKILTDERYSDGLPLMTWRFTKGILAIPDFLKKTNYQNPTDPNNTAFSLGHNSDLGFFGHVATEPLLAKQFNNHMGVYAQGRPRWMDPGFYPVQEQLVDGTEIGENDTLLVDIGGSFGHDISDFRRKWPDAPGKLALQDLPEVVAQVKDLDASIEVMAHDFFKEQPIKGARAYYMHSVLHDWPNEVCKKILANIVAAMKPGYSKLLINENVIPDTGAFWETTSLDMIMMIIGSGERTQRQWRDLLESSGLKITKVWTAQRGVESLIQCERA